MDYPKRLSDQGDFFGQSVVNLVEDWWKESEEEVWGEGQRQSAQSSSLRGSMGAGHCHRVLGPTRRPVLVPSTSQLRYASRHVCESMGSPCFSDRHLVIRGGEGRTGKPVEGRRRDVCLRANLSNGAGVAREGTTGFASIPEALEDIACGKFVVVLDDEDRENEGDLIIAGDKMTTEATAFMVEHTSGLICTAMTGDDLDRLNLPLMVDSAENKEAMRTAFTISVDLAEGVTTGISASDRCKTMQRLSDPQSQASDFQKPGHIFPLRYEPGGVLVRGGHTEAAVDLSRLAGCHPTGVLCEIVDRRDGSMALTPYLCEFAEQHNLKCITIAELIKYRMEHDSIVQNPGVASINLNERSCKAYSFQSLFDKSEYVAFVIGDIGGRHNVPVHLHSANFIADALVPRLGHAMQSMKNEDCGVVVYMVDGSKGPYSTLNYLLEGLGVGGSVENEPFSNSRRVAAIDQILCKLGAESTSLPYQGVSKFPRQQLNFSIHQDTVGDPPLEAQNLMDLNSLCHNGTGSHRHNI